MVFEECIPMKELAYYTSRGGLGKSFMTIQIGVALTLGRPVLNGDYPFLTPVKPRKVVIIGGEDYKENYHYRLSGILKDMNLTEDERRQVGSSLLIKSMVGEDIRIIADENGSTKITDFIDRMVETLRPLGDIGLIIFDPQSRFYGGNENDNPTATMFVNAVSRIGRELGAAQLVVHHAPKGDPTGARGASGFIDGARTHLSMISLAYMKSQVKGAVIDDGDAKKPVLSMLKSNHAKMWDRPVIMERTDNGGFKTMVASESDNSALRRVEERERMLAIVNFVRANGAQSKTAIENERKNINFNGATPGRNEIRRLLDKVVEQGNLTSVDDGHKLEIPNRNAGGSVF